MSVNHCEEKSPLESDLFIKTFEYGNADGRERYWTYDHMVLQVEDILDVLFIAYGIQFDVLLLFDHSCSHDRMRCDALHVNSMAVGFGGKSASMTHSSTIAEVDGYLGKYMYPDRWNEQLAVGMEQSFVYSEKDIGPFNLSSEEHQRRKYDINLGSGKPRKNMT
eukprot:8061520-Ditylum_brightwellii.AAC.2